MAKVLSSSIHQSGSYYSRLHCRPKSGMGTVPDAENVLDNRSNISTSSSPTCPAEQDLPTKVEKESKTEDVRDLPVLNSSIPGLLGVLGRTVSRSSYVDPGPPPDGGLTAWTQAIMGHLIVFNTWGYINCFGVFQTYYAHTLNHSPSDISWIGSTQVFLLFFVGTFSGRASKCSLNAQSKGPC